MAEESIPQATNTIAKEENGRWHGDIFIERDHVVWAHLEVMASCQDTLAEMANALTEHAANVRANGVGWLTRDVGGHLRGPVFIVNATGYGFAMVWASGDIPLRTLAAAFAQWVLKLPPEIKVASSIIQG